MYTPWIGRGILGVNCSCQRAQYNVPFSIGSTQDYPIHSQMCRNHCVMLLPTIFCSLPNWRYIDSAEIIYGHCFVVGCTRRGREGGKTKWKRACARNKGWNAERNVGILKKEARGERRVFFCADKFKCFSGLMVLYSNSWIFVNCNGSLLLLPFSRIDFFSDCACYRIS